MTRFPTTPGSLIRATAPDRWGPTVFMLITPEEPSAIPHWACPDEPEESYSQSDLALIEVLHDENLRQAMAPVLLSRAEASDLAGGLSSAAERGVAVWLAYDPGDQAIKAKIDGRWSPPMGTAER